jgi:hypothetical protein
MHLSVAKLLLPTRDGFSGSADTLRLISPVRLIWTFGVLMTIQLGYLSDGCNPWSGNVHAGGLKGGKLGL